MAFGDFTVTRASTKLRIGSNGLYGSVANNVPAFEFNTDGSYRGLLVEPGATNLVLRSQEFNDASWVKTNITVSADATTDPAGGSTADKLTPTVTNDLHICESSLVSITSGTVYTVSFFAKRAGYDFVQWSMSSALLSTRANFNLLNGTLGTVDAGITATITSVGNDWYRCTATFTAGGTGSFRAILANITTSSMARFATFAGDGTSGIFIWQAQLETGSVATSPIVTTAGTASRVADVVSLTGASSLIGQTEGTLYAEVQISAFGNAGVFFSVSDATTNNRIQLYKFTDAKIRADRISATQSTLTSIATDVVSAGMFKVAFAYKTGDSALFINGVQIGSTATQTFTFGAMGRIDIGARFDSTQIFNDHIRSVALFPTRLANATLQALTT